MVRLVLGMLKYYICVMQTTNIYILIDPETNLIRYVGKANNISQRYKAHLNRARKHQIHKARWIAQLRSKGLKPRIEVLDIVFIEEWQFWESFWICQIRSWGFDLVNYTGGGEGCTFANQTSFKKGLIPWNTGKSPSKETRELIRKGTLGNTSKPRKPVDKYSIENIFLETYPSVTIAAKIVKGSEGHITMCCQGKRKTHKKFKWKYHGKQN